VVLKNLLVTGYAAEGKSLARHEGKVVFMEKAVPGDEVDVLLTRSKNDWAEGHVIHYHKLADNRIEPFCEHFGVCGGCQWQMLPYAQQLAYKQQQVYDQLTRIGGVSPEKMLPIAGCDTTTGYRNKIEFTFANKRYLLPQEVKDESISGLGAFAGYHARGIFDKVVQINHCHLAPEPINKIRDLLKQKALELNMPFFDIRQHQGWMRGVQYRICTTGQLMVNVILGYAEPQAQQALLDTLLEEVPAITTLYCTINSKQNDSLYGLEPQLIFGPPHATEVLEDFQFLISPKSFFQTNTRQAEKLYSIARSMAELTGQEVVYDLYCGTGSIGIFVSRQAKKIIGVELVEEAIADARANASLNGLSHACFFTGDVVDICNDDFFATHGRPDVIITDPPRAGMHEKLVRKILEMEAPTVVYVSCNPATQARDLKWLSEKYEVTQCQPVDMFPHTHHIENVVQLKLRQGGVVDQLTG
jgi:23S rRNA (uracil1939-C5)-methyltransferase